MRMGSHPQEGQNCFTYESEVDWFTCNNSTNLIGINTAGLCTYSEGFVGIV